MKKTKNPLINIVTVAGPGRTKELIRLIKSIYRSTYKNFEIIVVDNSENPHLTKTIEKKFPQVCLLRMPHNTGVLGFNIGFANAKGDYILALDDDCTILPSTLKNIADIFPKKPRNVGILSTNIYKPLFRNYCFTPTAASRKPRASMLGDEVPPRRRRGRAASEEEAASLHACGVFTHYLKNKVTNIYISANMAVYRKSLFAKVGYFDPDFFLWVHEDDFSIRVLAQGFKIHFEPNIVVYHYEKAPSLRKDMCYILPRNLAWFNIKHFCLFFWPALIARNLVTIFLMPIKRKSALAFFLALAGYLVGWLTFYIPLKKRKAVSLELQKKFLKFYFNCIKPKAPELLVGG